MPALRLAVEVDGPSHFCRNSSPASASADNGAAAAPAAPAPRPLGGTLLKRRLLEQEGWRVVSVNTTAWEALRGAAAKRTFLAAAAESVTAAPAGAAG